MGDFQTGVIRLSSGGVRQVRLRRGTSDPPTFSMIFRRRDYDLAQLRRGAELHALYDGMLRDGRRPLVVDCGANIGLSALFFTDRFPAAEIVAIEPADDNVELMRENCRDCERIHILQAAVASTPGRARILDPRAGKDSYRTEITPDGNAGVPAVTIGQLVEQFDRDGRIEPFIVKIDIEGAEQELFSRDTGWLERFPLLIIELHDWLFPGRATSQPFLRTVAALGRDFVHINENIFSIRNPL